MNWLGKVFTETSPFEWLKLVVPPLVSIIVVGLTALGFAYNTRKIFLEQKRFENQRLAYSNLMASKMSWSQSVRSQIDAVLDQEFWRVTYQDFGEKDRDYQLWVKASERSITLITGIAVEQKEVFRNLALVQLYFTNTHELSTAVSNLYHVGTIIIDKDYPNGFPNNKELIKFHNMQKADTWKLIKSRYVDQLDVLLVELQRQIQIEQPTE